MLWLEGSGDCDGEDCFWLGNVGRIGVTKRPELGCLSTPKITLFMGLDWVYADFWAIVMGLY